MDKEEAKVITFKSQAEMPPMPASLGTTLYNETGAWRYLRPVYVNRTPPCNYRCPAGEDIVAYLSLVAERRYEEAWQLIMEENPLPGVCGRVCPHFCEQECNRRDLGEAIAVHCVERFLADRAHAEGFTLPPPEQRYTEKVAIVGSGPAGLSCAYHLARLGYPVTLFEAQDQLGGMLRLIPEYRLPRQVLEAEIADILTQGVEVRTGECLGKTLSFDELAQYDAVLLATGQTVSRKLGVSGEESSGVSCGIDFLSCVERGERVDVGSEVVVVGGGNTAMDAARTSRRLGADVTVLYRRSRTEMPAGEDEIEEALAEGVHFTYLAAPVEVLTADGRVRGLKCVRMELGEPDKSGRRRPIPIAGSEFELECDTVIPALGQVADLSFLERGWGVQAEGGRVLIDDAGATGRPAVFAAGDVATGYGTVTHAVGSGKRAALSIHRFLRGEELADFPPLERNVRASPREMDPTVVSYEDINTVYFDELPGLEQEQLDPATRAQNFSEVNLPVDEEALVAEVLRCFSCGTCNECDNCLIFCPDAAVLRDGATPYVFNYDYCKGCGVCASECPRGVIVMEEEIKWKK
ncbi:MAG: NAD(P)-binding protein [Anaerolineae bacterium]